MVNMKKLFIFVLSIFIILNSSLVLSNPNIELKIINSLYFIDEKIVKKSQYDLFLPSWKKTKVEIDRLIEEEKRDFINKQIRLNNKLNNKRIASEFNLKINQIGKKNYYFYDGNLISKKEYDERLNLVDEREDQLIIQEVNEITSLKIGNKIYFFNFGYLITKNEYDLINDINKKKEEEKRKLEEEKRKLEEEKRKLEEEKRIAASKKVEEKRIKEAEQRKLSLKDYPGFKDLKPGLTYEDVLKICSLRKNTWVKCYGIDNIKFKGDYQSNLLKQLSLDMGPIVETGGYLGIFGEGDSNIFIKMKNTFDKKYTLDYGYSERDRQLFNESEKDRLLHVYSKGQVVLEINRKEKDYSNDLWLYVHYFDSTSAKSVLERNKPIRASDDDF